MDVRIHMPREAEMLDAEAVRFGGNSLGRIRAVAERRMSVIVRKKHGQLPLC
jgi:hypothetical protein